MTTRRWMIAAAVVAVLIQSGQTGARWHQYRKRAEYHTSEFTKLRMMLAPALEYRREAGHFPGCGLSQIFWERAGEQAEWHGLLKSKYERAAVRPWLIAEPDPREPE
jgi:hypothetical protein